MPFSGLGDERQTELQKTRQHRQPEHRLDYLPVAHSRGKRHDQFAVGQEPVDREHHSEKHRQRQNQRDQLGHGQHGDDEVIQARSLVGDDLQLRQPLRQNGDRGQRQQNGGQRLQHLPEEVILQSRHLWPVILCCALAFQGRWASLPLPVIR
jgi:hypothetical protein